MRKLAMAVGILGALATADTGMADVLTPQIQPQYGLVPTTKIIKVTRLADAGGSTHYTGGALMYGVDIQNTGKTASTVTLSFAGTKAPLPPQTFEMLPGSTKNVLVTDPQGLDSLCADYDYTLTLAGPLADTRARHAKLTQTCTVKTKVTDPWDVAVPDRVEEAKSKHVFAQYVKIESEPTCAVGMKWKAFVTNQTSKAVAISMGAQANNVGINHTNLTVAAGKGVDVIGAPITTKDVGAQPYFVKVSDQNGVATPTIFVNQGITFTTTRSCKIDVALVP